MKNIYKNKAALLYGIFYLIIFSFVGCSSNEKDLKKIDFYIDWSPGPDYIGYYVSDELGYYKEKGFDVTVKTGNGAEPAAKNIKDGNIKIGTTTVDALVRQELVQYKHEGWDKYKKINNTPIIAAILFTTNPVVVITKDKINNINQLSGKIIGFSEETSVTYNQFLSLLNKNKELRKKITLVKVGWNGPQEFREGKINCLLAYATDVPPELEVDNVKFYSNKLADFGMNIPGQCIALSSNLKQNENILKEDVVTKIVEASIKGWEFARKNNVKAAEIFVARFPGQDKAKVIKSINYTVDLLPNSIGGVISDEYYGKDKINEQVVSTIKIISKNMDIRLSDEQIKYISTKLVR
jgi:NitT/TauT family transport system substrate-binding protein